MWWCDVFILLLKLFTSLKIENWLNLFSWVLVHVKRLVKASYCKICKFSLKDKVSVQQQ